MILLDFALYEGVKYVKEVNEIAINTTMDVDIKVWKLTLNRYIFCCMVIILQSSHVGIWDSVFISSLAKNCVFTYFKLKQQLYSVIFSLPKKPNKGPIIEVILHTLKVF